MSVCTNTTPQFNRKTDPGEMMGGSESVTLQVTPLESQKWGRGGGLHKLVKSPCTPKALSLGVERKIVCVKNSSLLIGVFRALK